ncbi:hypothetical protein BKA61DRAFT_730082 [Leptodontidium sp. MPI-SDFR-AT-0119]|nr:hypothetical protein BKA61DRAFT_730082 [Leptodontidium sp. MPI-SDFR-AT-0119]
MPRIFQKVAVIAVIIFAATILIFKAPFSFSSTPPPEPTYKSGLRWFHPEGFPSVDEWEDRLRDHKIFLGPSYSLKIPNPAAPNIEFPEQTRFIFPASVITCDWIERRLNVEMDWDGVVKEVYYG